MANGNTNNNNGNGRRQPQRGECHQYARIYAESFHWRVIPLQPGGKVPLTKNGSGDGTTDLALIDEWWGQWPDANVGVCTGVESGLVVVDLDPGHGGTLDALRAVLGDQPPTKYVRTGSGGYHFYFRHPEDYPEAGGVVPNSAGRTDDQGRRYGIADGIDVRGKGGYVVAPPSVHPNGTKYAWESPKGEGVLMLPWAPLLAAQRAREGDRPHLESRVGSAETDGAKVTTGRNNFLTTWAGTLRRKGMEGPEILAALDALNQSRCEPPLPAGEVRSIARSVSRYQPDDEANLISAHAEQEEHRAKVQQRLERLRQRDAARREGRPVPSGDAADQPAAVPSVPVPDTLRLDQQEQHILACVLSEGQLDPELQAHCAQNGLLADVATLLAPHHFYHDEARAVARAAWDLDAEHEPVTLYTLDVKLKGSESYHPEHVAEWVSKVTRTDWEPYVRDLCEAVREAALKRQLLDLGAKLQSKALSFEEAGDIAVEYSETLRALGADTMDGADDLAAHTAKYRAQLAWWRAHRGQIQGASTGIYALDMVTSGITRGSFWVVAARASMGKTALALTCALHNAQQNQKLYDEGQAAARDGLPPPAGYDGRRHLVGVISLEMSGPSLIHRLTGMLTGYAPFDIMVSAPHVDPRAVDEAVDYIERLPLRLLDASTSVRRTNGSRGQITPDAIRRRIEAWRREGPMDLVIVDYLQLLKPNEEHKREPREQQVASMSAAMKALAIDLDIGLLMLAQLNRGVEQSDGRQPQISDIRESGAVEQDADIILLLFRRDYYTDKGIEVADGQEHGRAREGVAQIAIGKNRNGPTKKLNAYYRKKTMRYYDYDEASDSVRDYWGAPVGVPERYEVAAGARVVTALPAAPAAQHGPGAGRPRPIPMAFDARTGKFEPVVDEDPDPQMQMEMEERDEEDA